MPIYEYVCSKCGHEWDTIQKFSEKPLTTCPKCGKKSAKRKISAAAFHLKGSGWYVTDYKGGASASKEKEEKETGTEAAASTADKAETKTGSKDDGPSKAPKAVTKTEKRPPSRPSTKKKSRTRRA